MGRLSHVTAGGRDAVGGNQLEDVFLLHQAPQGKSFVPPEQKFIRRSGFLSGVGPPTTSNLSKPLGKKFTLLSVWHEVNYSPITDCVIHSVVMFCFVSCQKFRLPVGLHSSCSISPTAGGTCQKSSTKYHDRGDVPQCILSQTSHYESFVKRDWGSVDPLEVCFHKFCRERICL